MVRGKSFVNARMGPIEGTAFHVERTDVAGPTGVLVERFVRWLEWPLTVRDVPSHAEVIVVPGARVHRDGSLSRSAAERVAAAAELYAEGWAPLILMTGGAPDGGPIEAARMASEAARLGVPERALLLEMDSNNSWENADLSAVILRRLRLTRAILVTHAFHTRRLKRAFLRRGILAQAWPVRTTWMQSGDPRALEPIVREYVALGIDLLGGRR